MSNMTEFGANLKIGSDSTITAEERVVALCTATVNLSEAFDASEISQQEFSATLKAILPDLRENEKASRILATARRELAEEEARSAAAAAEAVREQAAEYQAMATAKQAATSSRLAEESEREALAIQHEIEMLAHEERELAAGTAAREHYTAIVGHEIAAFEASEREQLQKAGAVAQETTAEARAAEATARETNALWAEVAALENAEREALQFANAEFAAAGAMEHFTVDASAAASATGRLGVAAGATRGGTGSLQQSITAGSYAFQDFTATSGDLGAKLNSISNNLPTLLIGLGGLGVALSVAATAGIAVYRNWNDIAGFWEDRNPFPKAADDIDGLKREFDRAKESIEKMEKAGSGNAAQLAEYNRLRSETARLEKEIAEQQERQQRTKKFLGSVSEEQEGRAKGYEEATKGKGQATLDKLTEAYRHDIDNEEEAARVGMALRIEAIRNSNKSDEEKAALVKEETEKYSATVRRLRDPANDPAKLAASLNDRLIRGEEAAFTALDRLMNETGVVFGDLREKIKEANPQLKKKREELDKAIEDFDKDMDAGTKHEAKEKKKGQTELDRAIEFFDRDADAGTKFLEKAKKEQDDKRREAEIKAANDAVARQAKEAEAKDKAEAGTILGKAPKDAAERFRSTVEGSMLPAEEAARQLVDMLTEQFRRAGHEAGGANLAARQIAGKAGFVVAAPAPFVGPAVPASVRKANAEAAKKPQRARNGREHLQTSRNRRWTKRRPIGRPRSDRKKQGRRKTPANDGGQGFRSVSPTPEPQAALPRVLDQVAQVQTAVSARSRSTRSSSRAWPCSSAVRRHSNPPIAACSRERASTSQPPVTPGGT